MATRLARAGHRVLLLDKATFPRHKACSEYVNAAGVAILDDLGILDEARQAGAHSMEAMIVHAPDGGRFIADFARAEPGRAALGLSRFTLDRLLLDQARTSGATVCERTHVRRLLREDGRVIGVEARINGVAEQIRAPLVIGADG